jgi:hypothetical protein
MVAYVKQIPLFISLFLLGCLLGFGLEMEDEEDEEKRREEHTMNRTMIHLVFGLNESNRSLLLLSPYSSVAQ